MCYSILQMKSLAISVLVVLMWNQPVQKHTYKPYQNDKQANWGPKILVGAATYFPLSRHPQSTTEHPNAEQEPEHWYQYLWSQNASNWTLVIVAGIGLWFARRALRANEDAAKAALLNAQAVIASERAWIFVEFVPDCIEFSDKRWYHRDTKTSLDANELALGLQYGYKIIASNIGKTPATVLTLVTDYSLLNKDARALVSSDVGTFQRGTQPMEYVVTPDNPVQIGWTNIRDYMTDARPEITKLEKTAVFHGYAVYRPFIDESADCFADFCYVFQASSKTLIRRDMYNTRKHKNK